MARKQSLCGLLNQINGLCALPLCVVEPLLEICRQDIILCMRTLETEFGNILLALLEVVGFEVATRSGYHLAVNLYFGLQERGLIKQIIIVIVVTCHLDSNHIVAALQIWFEVDAVDTVEVVGGNRGAVSHKLTVYAQTVVARSRQTHIGLAYTTCVDYFSERKCEVALRFASFGPNRLGCDKRITLFEVDSGCLSAACKYRHDNGQ